MNNETKTLYAIRDRLNRKVEAAIKNLPEKQELDAVNLLIERAEKANKSSNELTDSDAIMEAVVAYFEGNGNAPTKMKNVALGLEKQGTVIRTGRPGTTIAAIMTRSEKWKDKFRNKEGLWNMKE